MSEPAVKQIVLASRPKGLPTHENFRLQDVPMPQLPQGGLLLRVLYLSLDPYMRGRMDDRKSYAKPASIGGVMPGESVCEVIASDQAGYAVGDIVLAHTGWRTHAASAGAALRKLDPAAAPITTGLGVLGMPGFTAYAGLNLIGKPKPGETVVVAAASGPVGSLVGQLAKLSGARAVGIAGGSERNAALSSKSFASMPLSIIVHPTLPKSSQLPARTGSMFILKTSVAPCGKPCCLCSTRLRACRCAG
jgi:NADPH-dependent curcumin reductase CurA